jgi:hypothetical protein
MRAKVTKGFLICLIIMYIRVIILMNGCFLLTKVSFLLTKVKNIY